MARRRRTEKAWSIVTNNKINVRTAKRDLEKQGYKVIGTTTLPSEENIMVIGERWIRGE